MENKLFIAFAVITIISGIILVIQKDYVSGIAGAIVGLFILYLNLKAIKDEKKNTE